MLLFSPHGALRRDIGARFAIRMAHMLTPDKPKDADELFDEPALVAELAKLADEHAGSEQELRRAVAQRLKAVLATGRSRPSSCC